jgi:hypothetical protein
MGSASDHLRAAEVHDETARGHAEAAERWAARGDETRAEFELWNASFARLTAELERARAGSSSPATARTSWGTRGRVTPPSRIAAT